MKRLILAPLVLALAACGGGGGGGSGSAMPLIAAQVAPQPAPAAVVAEAVAPTPPSKPLPPIPAELRNSNCTPVANRIDCELSAGLIGTGVPVGKYLTFTNRTAGYLQVDEVRAYTNERTHWAEFCVHLDAFLTGQSKPGAGEVGCTSKQIGEDYAAVTWGGATGLSVPPGGVVILNSHTEPHNINHTYALTVREQTSGVNAWRFPVMDQVIDCNDQMQATPWTPQRNDTGAPLYVSGATVYAESGSASNTLAGGACVYVLNADGSEKWRTCEDGLRTRGFVAWPSVEVLPGESVAAQGTSFCPSPNAWGWAAFVRMNGGAA